MRWIFKNCYPSLKKEREPKAETQTQERRLQSQLSGGSEGETIFTPSDRAKGSAECLIMSF